MLIHVHSKNGHDAIVPLLSMRLATSVGSLDPMADGSTASFIECPHVELVSQIAAMPGITIIPKYGTVGKEIAALFTQYGVKETQTKRDVLGLFTAAQRNHFFDPSLADVS